MTNWVSADALFESADEELKIWNRSDLESHIGMENRSLSALAKRNHRIRARHDQGLSVEDLMAAYDLSQRQVLRIIAQER
jgi:hypothetical protein